MICGLVVLAQIDDELQGKHAATRGSTCAACRHLALSKSLIWPGGGHYPTQIKAGEKGQVKSGRPAVGSEESEAKRYAEHDDRPLETLTD